MKEYIDIRLTEEFINFICKKPHGREAIEEYLIGLHDSIIEDISKWSETMLVSAVIDTADPATISFIPGTNMPSSILIWIN